MAETTKALVTGGAGFIGSHLVTRLLEEGYGVVVVDNLSTGQLRNLNQQTSFYHVELNDTRLDQIIQRERPELVFHLAAQCSVRKSADDPVSDAATNVVGTIRLLHIAAREGVEKFILSSTGGAIYGDPDVIPCNETTPVNPLTPYGLSKRVGEQYLELFRNTYGLDYTILRYANVYGPGQDPHGEAGVVAIFAGMMLEGEQPRIYGDGRQERDFVYVSDVVEANLAAIRRGHGRTYNIGSGEPVSIERIYSLLQEIIGFDQGPNYRPRRTGEVLKIALDASLAQRELHWNPEVSLEEGLRHTVEYIRTQLADRPARSDASRERRRPQLPASPAPARDPGT